MDEITIEQIGKKLMEFELRIRNIETHLASFNHFRSLKYNDTPDSLLKDATDLVRQYELASASLLQRRLQIGYARAARILDQLTETGILGKGEGAKPRKVLLKNADKE